MDGRATPTTVMSGSIDTDCGLALHVLSEPTETDARDGAQVVMIFHAAGLHGRCYRKLAERLRDACEVPLLIVAPDLRAHGDSIVGSNGEGITFPNFAEDIKRLIQSRGWRGSVFGVGHSLGGMAAILAEYANPGLFAGLWVYEPVLFTSGDFSRIASARLAENARHRRATFPSAQAAYASYASKPPFDALDPDCLDDYVRFGVKETGGGDGSRDAAAAGGGGDGSVVLKCHPESEARVYMQGALPLDLDSILPALRCATTVVSGSNVGEANTLSRSADIVLSLIRKGGKGWGERYAFLGHFGPLERGGVGFVAGRIARGVERVVVMTTARGNGSTGGAREEKAANEKEEAVLPVYAMWTSPATFSSSMPSKL